MRVLWLLALIAAAWVLVLRFTSWEHEPPAKNFVAPIHRM